MAGVDMFAIDSNVHNKWQLFKKYLFLKKCVSVIQRFDKYTVDHVSHSAEKQNIVLCVKK